MPVVTDNVQPPSEPKKADQGQDSNLNKSSIGIIYPPPEVRNIVDKTASFVARNGPEFEARIKDNEINNPKFNFLNLGDPYYPYYQHKVKEFQDGKAQEPAFVAPVIEKQVSALQQKQQDLLRQEILIIPKDPPPKFEFVADPPSISAFDLDIVKLTAQFVARNGKQFLTNLMNREQRNYQFDFLRPQHSLFQYFTKLLEQYMMILIPDKSVLQKLKEESLNPKSVLDQVRYRVEWIKQQEAQRRREEEEAERERVAYAQIDWHDFVIVETVDYQPYETGQFPPPCCPEDVGSRMLMEERMDDVPETEMQIDSDVEEEEHGRIDGSNTQVQDMEEDSSTEGEDEEEEAVKGPRINIREGMALVNPTPTANPPTAQPPLPPVPDQVVVKKNYDPKNKNVARTNNPDEYLISPLTGEKIPASKVQEHMRIGLLDPRWVEQRDKQVNEKVNQESVYAGGGAIESSLKQLAERRTDIFGTGAEEAVIGKKIGEEEKKKDDRVIWDGHTASVEAATRAAQASISIEEQIQQIHKAKGLLPDEEKEKIGPQLTGGSAAKKMDLAKTTKPTVISAPPKVIQALPQPPKPNLSGGVFSPVVASSMVSPHMTGVLSQGMVVVPPPMGRGPPMMVLSGFPPGAHMGPPPMGAYPPMVGMSHMGDDDEPPNKRPKNEENLMPEAEFMAKHKLPVTFRVIVPTSNEKPEWRLNGQTISLTLPLSDTISVVKAKIHEETGVPPGKQKMQWEGLFFKDQNSLAYYNLAQGAIVILTMKERGGRKK